MAYLNTASRPFKRLYLHIGLSKTGTTSIQSFLQEHKEAIASQGVWFCSGRASGNHKPLSAAAFNHGSNDAAVRHLCTDRSEPGIRAFRSDVFEQFRREARSNPAETAIVSSEGLSRLYEPEEVARAVNLMAGVTEELKVVVFLRRQDLLATSRHHTLLVNGSKLQRVFPRPGTRQARYFDFNRTLGNWIECAGAENIIAIRYPERPSTEGFDAVDAFSQAVGLDQTGLQRRTQRNVSLDAVNRLILLAYNVSGTGTAAGRSALIEKIGRLGDRGCKQSVSALQARLFMEDYNEGNQRLFAALGLASDYFSDDFSMYPDANMEQAHLRQGLGRLATLLSEGS